MRILYFTRDYTPHDHRFLTSLAKTANKIFLLRLENRGIPLEDRPVPREVEQVAWAGGKRPARWQEGFQLLSSLKVVIRRIRPDIIHAGPIQKTAFLTAFSGFTPLVTMSWGSDILKDANRNVWWRFATRFTLDRTSVFLGDCDAVRLKAMEFGFPEKRIVLFPWGIDLERFSPGEDTFRQRMGWQNAFVVLCVRSWEPIYGVDMVVRAFIKSVNINPNMRLVLLGNGSQAEIIQRMINQNQLQDKVFLGGQVSQDKLPDFYRAADLYLSASHSDGSSVSLMEALGCGCPVLVSDIPGNREWIKSGDHGWLFPDGDENSLAEALQMASNAQKELDVMKQKNRLLAEQRADWSKNFEKLMQAYEMAKMTGLPG